MPKPDLSRRHLLRAAGAALVAGATSASSVAVTAGTAVAAVARRTTLAATARRGAPDAFGYRRVVAGPGERHVVRADLGIKPLKGRRRRRRGVLAFVQLSDVHCLDAQSPLRVEWTDRYDDQDLSEVPVTGLFGSAYRPHEIFAAHIADAMVRQLNRIGKGPVTREPLALAVQTGDNSDNAQYNEIRWNIDVLDGGQLRIDSGDLTRWEGVADDDPTYYDTHYWHPDPAPEGKPDDRAKAVFGFPTVPGLLDAVRRPFAAEGLAIPWITAFGNHDGLVQGNFPHATLPLAPMAVGGTKVISPPAGVSQGDVLKALLTGDVAGLLGQLSTSPSARQVTPDPDRRLLTRAEIVEEHFTTAGVPTGHGFTARNRADGTAYYSFTRGKVRFVVLDTVNPNGYSNGSIDAAQLAWLERTLAASRRKLVVVCSHHTSGTMDNAVMVTGGDPQPRVLGDEVVRVLLRHRNVIAWVNGHTHSNNIWEHRRPSGKGGFWEINTAAHIDWPQQSRIIEIADNRDGTLSIFTTMVDHGAPLSYDGDLDTPAGLAALGRELAANDWHERSATRKGRRKDRNVELLVDDPLR